MLKKETKFSKICEVVSNVFLVLAIVAPIIIALYYGRVEEYSWRGEFEGYERDWLLTIIYYVASFVSLFLVYVGFGAVSEHLQMMSYIASSVVPFKKDEENKKLLNTLKDTEKLFTDNR